MVYSCASIDLELERDAIRSAHIQEQGRCLFQQDCLPASSRCEIMGLGPYCGKGKPLVFWDVIWFSLQIFPGVFPLPCTVCRFFQKSLGSWPPWGHTGSSQYRQSCFCGLAFQLWWQRLFLYQPWGVKWRKSWIKSRHKTYGQMGEINKPFNWDFIVFPMKNQAFFFRSWGLLY